MRQQPNDSKMLKDIKRSTLSLQQKTSNKIKLCRYIRVFVCLNQKYFVRSACWTLADLTGVS